MYNFDEKIERKNSGSRKWDNPNQNYPDLKHEVLPMWVADMDFACPPCVNERLLKRLDTKAFGYTLLTDEYYSSVINWFQRRFSFNILKEDIFFSPGIVPALGVLVRALTEVGDGVIVQQPVYMPFMKMIKNNNRNIKNNQLVYENGKYSVNFSELEELAKDEKTKMMILCSPHNPVGKVFTKDELNKILDICKKNNVILVSDEIHCDLTRSNIKHYPVATLREDAKDFVITCTSPSKSFNVSGLPISNIIIKSDHLRKKWLGENVDKMANDLIPSFSMDAVIACYDGGEKWLEELKAYLDENVKCTEEFIKENIKNLKFCAPDGTYLAWIDFSQTKLTPDEIRDKLLNEGDLALLEGKNFGEGGEYFQRLNMGTRRELLIDGLNRLKRVFG